ncbi:MAG: caspase family protein [Reichenbachiella sp.]|uniref:caspase family protein n=1 Tax=Reichenbachiella sp. TaxID=2184521 RepID=UPI003299F799
MKTIPTLLLLCFVWTVNAQNATSVIKGVYLNFEIDAPAMINILSPRELVEKSRGLKNTQKKFIEVEGIVADEQGVRELRLNGDIIKVDDDGYFYSSFGLEVGLNELKFSVLDKNDNQTDTAFSLVRRYNEISTPDGGKYYALLMGIQNYEDSTFIDLDNPINDVKKLREVLVNDYAFSDENVNLVLDATREDIMNSLDHLSEVVTPNDNVLIFYAGHGIWDDESEIGYWLPSNAKAGKKAAWFRNSSLRDYIKEIDSKHTLLIADACFSGSIFKSRSVLVGADMATNKMHELPSRKAMTSGTLTAVPDRSVFLKYFLDRLEKNDQPYLAASQLFSSFRIAVMNNSEATPQYGVVQNAGDEGGDFIFIKREEQD